MLSSRPEAQCLLCPSALLLWVELNEEIQHLCSLSDFCFKTEILPRCAARLPSLCPDPASPKGIHAIRVRQDYLAPRLSCSQFTANDIVVTPTP